MLLTGEPVRRIRSMAPCQSVVPCRMIPCIRPGLEFPLCACKIGNIEKQQEFSLREPNPGQPVLKRPVANSVYTIIEKYQFNNIHIFLALVDVRAVYR